MHELKSLQLDDEDSSKYFINYVNEESDEHVDNNNNNHDTESLQSPADHDHTEIPSLPSSLIITPVPHELFTNQELKDEFERLFRAYDPQIVVLYLKFFQRVRITFTSSSNALQARLHLHEHLFHGSTLNTYFACPIVFRGANPETHLKPPEPDKLFLISPPVSPPIGWEQKIEDPPVVDLNLIAAIAQLQPNQSHQILPRELGSTAPAIIIHTCDDNEEVNMIGREKLIKPTLIQTRRPAGADKEL